MHSAWSYLKQLQYNITLLPSVNTQTARGMFCCAKYTHHTFTPTIKHLNTTTANKHPGTKSFIDKNMRKSHWYEVVHITKNEIALSDDPRLKVTVLIKAIIRIIQKNN